MKKITLINSLVCVAAISLGLFWLYLRVSRKTPTIPLIPEVIEKYKFYLVFIQYFSITMLFLIIFTTIVAFYLKNKPVVKESLFYKLTKKTKEFFTKMNIFFRAYEILFKATSVNFRIYFMDVVKFCLALNSKTNLGIILFFVSLPKITILLILCMEIYFGQLHYYFYSLILLLLPLIFKLLLFMLRDVGHRVLPELNEVIQQTTSETTYKDAEGLEKKGLIIQYSLTPEYSDLVLDWVMKDYYYPALFIEGHITEVIDPKVHIISKITQIFYYSITLIAFTYILYL